MHPLGLDEGSWEMHSSHFIWSAISLCLAHRGRTLPLRIVLSACHSCCLACLRTQKAFSYHVLFFCFFVVGHVTCSMQSPVPSQSVCMHVCMDGWMYVCMYEYVCIYVCLFACMLACNYFCYLKSRGPGPVAKKTNRF